MRTIGEGRPQGERVPPAQEKREQSGEVVKVLLSPDCCGREGKVGGQVSYSPSRQEQRVVGLDVSGIMRERDPVEQSFLVLQV